LLAASAADKVKMVRVIENSSGGEAVDVGMIGEVVAAVAVILISTAPMVLFQQKMKEKKILMTLSLIGVVAGSIYLWFLTDGGLFFGSK
jgi:hypothetical protein